MEQSSTNIPSTGASYSPNTQIPPSGPAQTSQLPTFVNGSNSVEETKIDSNVPVHTQFESLSINTPLQPAKFPSVQINNEISGSQQSADDNNSIENDASINPAGDLSSDDGTRGMD